MNRYTYYNSDLDAFELYHLEYAYLNLHARPPAFHMHSRNPNRSFSRYINSVYRIPGQKSFSKHPRNPESNLQTNTML
ncbi:hypothetical protein TWF106_005360 [Orbilia oligospora]|uniref:Uncharacterized protein n=1 Tax=Orbilia oligospora TaxID=2813651 RepID=A0A7C8U5N9_ORBOL|nr:hypothetical protein TWF106_005360 [Orbilia oligospora]